MQSQCSGHGELFSEVDHDVMRVFTDTRQYVKHIANNLTWQQIKLDSHSFDSFFLDKFIV